VSPRPNLASASHSADHEPPRPQVRQHVADAHHDLRRRHRDDVGEDDQHVIVAAQVVCSRVLGLQLAHALRPPRGTQRVAVHRHPDVRRDRHQVQRDPREDDGEPRQPHVREGEDHQQRVREDERAQDDPSGER